jgi:outer membrane receptor for ferrienterochelin and colicin
MVARHPLVREARFFCAFLTSALRIVTTPLFGSDPAMNVSRVVRCITTSAVVALALPHGARAQQPDSTKKSSDTLEAVVVKAVRSTLATPAAQSTMTREEISKTFVGQDVPNFLNTMPSMTS